MPMSFSQSLAHTRMHILETLHSSISDSPALHVMKLPGLAASMPMVGRSVVSSSDRKTHPKALATLNKTCVILGASVFDLSALIGFVLGLKQVTLQAVGCPRQLLGAQL